MYIGTWFHTGVFDLRKLVSRVCVIPICKYDLVNRVTLPLINQISEWGHMTSNQLNLIGCRSRDPIHYSDWVEVV